MTDFDADDAFDFLGIFAEFPVALLVLVCICAIVATCMANCYFDKDKIQTEIRQFNPAVVKIESVERNIFDESRFVCSTLNEQKIAICLDSNIAFDHTFSVCSTE